MSLLYMKPWITEAIGMQNVALPSSVLQAATAKSGKFCSSGMPVSESSLPFWNSCRAASNGRQVIRSPAVPPSSLARSAASYSRGRRRLELDLDVRVLGLEGRDDLLLPDRQVVVAPALDHELGRLRRGEAGAGEQQGRQRQCGTTGSVMRMPPWGVTSVIGGVDRARAAQVAAAPRRSRAGAVSGSRPSSSSTASLMSRPARSQAAAAASTDRSRRSPGRSAGCGRRAWRWPARR